ncbi:MAG: hypothetical protein ABIA04_01365 [Pseudomonadota bacterium]
MKKLLLLLLVLTFFTISCSCKKPCTKETDWDKVKQDREKAMQELDENVENNEEEAQE